jgi:hypothetical protein
MYLNINNNNNKLNKIINTESKETNNNEKNDLLKNTPNQQNSSNKPQVKVKSKIDSMKNVIATQEMIEDLNKQSIIPFFTDKEYKYCS